MKTSSLDYELPAELIAQQPAVDRSRSRMLVLDRKTGAVQDRHFHEIGEFLKADDCLVINDTKVIPARFFAKRQSGAKLEGLFLDAKDTSWQVMLKGLRKLAVGEKIILTDRNGQAFCEAVVIEKAGDGKCVLAVGEAVESACAAELYTLQAFEILEQIGVAPLPPYIKRVGGDGADEDRDRYQTVYAAKPGAVAAPTAGLHFTDELLDQLRSKGVEVARVTLHVGAGTFKPVTVEELEQHEIHSEWYEVTSENAEKINEARRKGGRIIAVGTTSVRTLETAWADGAVQPGSGTTKLYILPGYEFRAVDVIVTNFHLPRSTLLALVGAFAGMENVMAAYRHAVGQRYRFFSYGDAMLIIGDRNRV